MAKVMFDEDDDILVASSFSGTFHLPTTNATINSTTISSVGAKPFLLKVSLDDGTFDTATLVNTTSQDSFIDIVTDLVDQNYCGSKATYLVSTLSCNEKGEDCTGRISAFNGHHTNSTKAESPFDTFESRGNIIEVSLGNLPKESPQQVPSSSYFGVKAPISGPACHVFTYGRFIGTGSKFLGLAGDKPIDVAFISGMKVALGTTPKWLSLTKSKRVLLSNYGPKFYQLRRILEPESAYCWTYIKEIRLFL
ncbi:hypothetical protein HDU97_003974 [Phlyctochytrium planicorne]|nr:hypothetical protein HDU97_003974 [Phlyctochytrium planicorne]